MCMQSVGASFKCHFISLSASSFPYLRNQQSIVKSMILALFRMAAPRTMGTEFVICVGLFEISKRVSSSPGFPTAMAPAKLERRRCLFQSPSLMRLVFLILSLRCRENPYELKQPSSIIHISSMYRQEGVSGAYQFDSSFP